jgi:twinkle protein
MMDWHDLGIDVRGRAVGQIKTKCPKCGPRSRHKNKTDLSVDLDRGLYNCHNNDCDFQGRISSAPDWREWKPAPVYVKPDVPPERGLLPKSRAFFTARGIDLGIAEEMGVYSKPDDSAIAFPYTRDGEIVHIKYRALDEKRFWSSKDSEPVFYNLDRASGASVVVICEGELDALALMTIGVDSVVSLPNGAPGPGQEADGKLACLASAEAMLEAAEQIIIAVDDDAPGVTLAGELIRRIGPAKCARVAWPEGAKDANDVLMGAGPDALADCVAGARPVPINGIIYANDVREEMWRNREGRRRQGVEITVWPRFNELFRMGESQLTVITGTPSAGKSAFVQAMAANVAKADPSWAFAFFTPEESPADDWYAKIAQLKLGNRLDQVTRDEYDEAVDWADRHFILESPEIPTLDHILELARVCVLRHGVKGVVIDPYTEVETPRLPGVGESEHVGNNLAKIRAFGQRHRVHMVIAAHPVKPDRTQHEKPVGPYDISGSANWFNKADMMLSVYRHDRSLDTSPVDVHVQKVRKAHFGRVGSASFGFHMDSGRYFEIERQPS